MNCQERAGELTAIDPAGRLSILNSAREGNAGGPTFCYRRLANDSYYILEQDKSRYADYKGCGNTLNANQPIVRRMIQGSLRHRVTRMHVDGFRFDLATRSRQSSRRPLCARPHLSSLCGTMARAPHDLGKSLSSRYGDAQHPERLSGDPGGEAVERRAHAVGRTNRDFEQASALSIIRPCTTTRLPWAGIRRPWKESRREPEAPQAAFGGKLAGGTK